MELSTITITVPTEHLGSIMRVVADLMSKGVSKHFAQNSNTKQNKKPRTKNSLSAACRQISQLKKLSVESLDDTSKVVFAETIGTIVSGVAGHLSRTNSAPEIISALAAEKCLETKDMTAIRNLKVVADSAISVSKAGMKDNALAAVDKSRGTRKAEWATVGKGKKMIASSIPKHSAVRPPLDYSSNTHSCGGNHKLCNYASLYANDNDRFVHPFDGHSVRISDVCRFGESVVGCENCPHFQVL